jgi:hypothetical protein
LNPRLKTFLVTGTIAVLAALSVILAVGRAKQFHERGEDGARVWFYDQSAKRLYPAPRGLIPPDGNGANRVRAMVIGFQGMGNNVSQLKIAYLEKFSPEFKALLERAEAARAAQQPFHETVPGQSSDYYHQNTWIKRPDETEWHRAGTPEARQIMGAWHQWSGPAGQAPVIADPSV